MALLKRVVDLNENAILNLSEFYAIKHNFQTGITYILQRFDGKILTDGRESEAIKELQKNIFLKLRDNENIGILVVDYNMISLIERNYNSLDFKRMVFIFVSDLCRQKMSPFAYDAQIEEFKKHTRENIVMLSHYNGSGVECRLFDKEYEEVF